MTPFSSSTPLDQSQIQGKMETVNEQKIPVQLGKEVKEATSKNLLIAIGRKSAYQATESSTTPTPSLPGPLQAQSNMPSTAKSSEPNKSESKPLPPNANKNIKSNILESNSEPRATSYSLKSKLSNCSLIQSIRRARSEPCVKFEEKIIPISVKSTNHLSYQSPIDRIHSVKSANHPSHQSGIDLIYSGARGEKITGAQYLISAQSLRDIQADHSEVNTTMLQLYEKAADEFMASGDVENVFKARAEAADTVKFSNTHPLFNMTKGIQNGISKQAIPDTGLHMESGSSKISGGLSFSTRPHADGTNRDVLNCQFSSFARQELTGKLEQIFGKVNPDTKLFENGNLLAFENNLPKNLAPVKIIFYDGKTIKKTEKINKIDENGVSAEKTITTTDFSSTYKFQGKDLEGKFTADTEKGIKFNSGSYEIEFSNGGKIVLGASPEFKFIYENLHVEVPTNQNEGEGLKQMQQMLTVLGLGPVISNSGKQHSDNDERLKLGLMLKTYFPQAWDEIEQNKHFYDMSPKDIRSEMIKLAPGIEDHFIKYENNPKLVTKVQIFPGKEMWALGDISKEMKKAGTYGLFSGTSMEGAIAFLNVGQLSTNERLLAAVNVTDGASFTEDVKSGGSEAVFLRAINNKVSETKISEDITQGFQFSGKVQVLYDINVINMGAVCYYGDQYGTKNAANINHKVFQNRMDPISFAKNLGTAMDKYSRKGAIPSGNELNSEGEVVDKETKKTISDPKKGADNEVGVDGGNIDPEFIKGLLVQDKQTKQILLQLMLEKNMIKDVIKDKDGNITKGVLIYRNGVGQKELRVSINDFIHVGNQLNEKFWKV